MDYLRRGIVSDTLSSQKAYQSLDPFLYLLFLLFLSLHSLSPLLPPTPLPSLPALCPIPILVEQVGSNYSYWKNLCDPADLNSGEDSNNESDTSQVRHLKKKKQTRTGFYKNQKCEIGMHWASTDIDYRMKKVLDQLALKNVTKKEKKIIHFGRCGFEPAHCKKVN